MGAPSLPERPDELEYATAVTLARAGELLGYSERSVRRRVAAGELRAVRVFGQRRIRLTELRRFLDEAEARASIRPLRSRQRA